MEKLKAFWKAHWKVIVPVLVTIAATLFLLLHKKSQQAIQAVVFPQQTGGGATGGSSSDPSAAASAAAGAAADAAGNASDAVRQRFNKPADKLGPGVMPFAVPFRPRGAAPSSPAVPWPQRAAAAVARGSGFRGGDVYPATWGDNRNIDERNAVSGPLPAAPLGSPILPKVALSTDVRRAPRRQTAISQVSRGAPPHQLPQSFSVPVRQHAERRRSVLSIEAQTGVNATAAGGGQVQAGGRVAAALPVPIVGKRHA